MIIAAARVAAHGQEALSEAHPQAQREEAGSNPALPSTGGWAPPVSPKRLSFADSRERPATRGGKL